MKKPWVLGCILVAFGLIAILLSVPSSFFTSMARSSNLSFEKQSLQDVQDKVLLCVSVPGMWKDYAKRECVTWSSSYLVAFNKEDRLIVSTGNSMKES